MPVLHVGTKRILYIHVPKTGGSYVERLLTSYGTVTGVRFTPTFGGLPCSPQHFHGELLEHVYSADLREVADPFDYVFMTTRNPLDRMVSEFAYRQAQRRIALVRARYGVPERFDRWLRSTLRVYRRDPFLLDNHVRPQHEFEAFDPQIFRLEDGLERITKALDEVTGLRGRPPPEPVNRSTRLQGQNIGLRRATRDRLVAHAREDYDRYGYALPR